MMRTLAFLGALLVASPSIADEGEVYLDVVLAPELAALTHPSSGAALPFAPTTAYTFFPRGGIAARYGVTDAVQVGLSVDGGFWPNVVSPGVKLEGYTGSLYSHFAAFTAAATLSYRFDSGYDFSGLGELQLGPTLGLWSDAAFADPTQLDANGLPTSIPLALETRWPVGATLRALVAFEARFFDVFVFAIGPQVSVTWLDGLSASVGLVLRPSFVHGLPVL